MSIQIIYAGGTIGMHGSEQGVMGENLKPSDDFAERLQDELSVMSGRPVPEVEVFSISEPSDSAHFGVKQWNEIGALLCSNLDSHEGAVVLHGTDTLAWTASALGFALSGLNKPVVVTGAQVPLSVSRSDAPLNLLASVRVASQPRLNEVVVCFGSRILRAVRSTKVDADGYDAFVAPCDVALGSIGAELRLYEERFLDPSSGPLRFRKYRNNKILQVAVSPLQPDSMLPALLELKPDAVVLELYGVGTAPLLQHGLLTGLEVARDAKIPVVAVSQSPQAVIDLLRYDVGQQIMESGVISGRDMTREAAGTKLAHLLSLDLGYEQLCRAIAADQCGELTPL